MNHIATKIGASVFAVLTSQVLIDLSVRANDLPDSSEWIFSVVETDTFAGTVTHVSAAVLANFVTPDLRWAAFEIDCSMGTLDDPSVGVSYIFYDDAMDEMDTKFLVRSIFRYANAYSFDLIGSNNSRRPAAYNLGNGFVRNDDYDEGTYSQRPEEYFERLEDFFDVFMTLEDEDKFEVRFVNTGRHSERMRGKYFSISFPMKNFSSHPDELTECINNFKNR